MNPNRHRVWCASLDPTPEACDCGALTDYDLGVRDGVQMSACAVCNTCRSGHRPEFQADPEPTFWHKATECRASGIWMLLR